MKLITALLFSTLSYLSAHAQLSYLDPQFGNNGVFLAAYDTNDYTIAAKTILQDDGAILVVGRGALDGFIARVNGNGTPDATFGQNGATVVPYMGIMGTYLILNDAVVLDDRILAGGFQQYGSVDTTVLMAFDLQGNPDPGFGTNGKRVFNFAALNVLPFEGIKRLIKTDATHVVAMGEVVNPVTGSLDILVAKFDQDGNLVTDFADNGVRYIDYAQGNDEAFAFISDDSGNFYLVGNTINNTGEHTLIVKLTANGAIDTDFAANGFLVQNFAVQLPEANAEMAWTCARWQNNSLILGGYHGYGRHRMLMQRIDQTGQIDQTFGTDGAFIMMWCSSGWGENTIMDLLVNPDQSITVAGTRNCNFDENFRMYACQLTPNGMLNNSFGNNGFILLPGLQNYDEKTLNMLAHPDGGFYQSGVSLQISGEYNFALVKYKGSAVGMADNDKSPFEVYPNPVSDALHITGSAIVTAAQLTNATGQSFPVLIREQTIDVATLPAGIYFLSLKDESGLTHIYKIIKQ